MGLHKDPDTFRLCVEEEETYTMLPSNAKFLLGGNTAFLVKNREERPKNN